MISIIVVVVVVVVLVSVVVAVVFEALIIIAFLFVAPITPIILVVFHVRSYRFPRPHVLLPSYIFFVLKCMFVSIVLIDSSAIIFNRLSSSVYHHFISGYLSPINRLL